MWPPRPVPAPQFRRAPRGPRLWSWIDEYLGQLLAQREHAGPNARLDGTERQREALGELGLRQPEEVSLFDQHALIGRQRFERARDGTLLLAHASARFRALDRLRLPPPP